MAYVSVAEWSPDQVAEWLKGLDDVLQPYIHSFVAKEITGSCLLHLAPDDFTPLNIACIGHQQIILQGIELLSNIHYQIHQENVQHLALRLSSKARNIYNELRVSQNFDGQFRNGLLGEEDKGNDDREVDFKSELNKEVKKERVSTRILSGVADVLSSVKVLVSWLHRTPFHGIEQYDELKSNLLDLSIRLATIAQRDSFAENPVSVVTECCSKLAEIADAIIQDSKDPLILQPAFLDVVTIKKRADDNWGLSIYSSYHGIHQISMLRPLSPAHTCGKLMGGDQVVQVNYQTVVGWTSHKVTQLMQENPVQIILTVKKCPRHVNTITEIYFKPFRLPSKKRTYSPWPNNAISGQPYDLPTIPTLQFIKSFDGRSAAQRAFSTEPHPKAPNTPLAASLNSSGSDAEHATGSESPADEEQDSDLDDDAFFSNGNYGSGNPSLSGRLFQPKPRPHVQRRATIPGAIARPMLHFDRLLPSYCQHQLGCTPIGDSFCQESCCSLFRSKECPDIRGLRPHTCIGTEKRQQQRESLKASHSQQRDEVTQEQDFKEDSSLPFIDESDEEGRCITPTQRFSRQSTPSSPVQKRPPINITPPSNETKEPSSRMSPPHSSSTTLRQYSSPKNAVDAEDEKLICRISDERPKLDKSYSSPTYDLEDREVVTFLESSSLDLPQIKASTSVDSPSNPEKHEITVVSSNEELPRSTERDTKEILFVSATENSAQVFSHISSTVPAPAMLPSPIFVQTTTSPPLPSLESANDRYWLGFKGNFLAVTPLTDDLSSTTHAPPASQVMCGNPLNSTLPVPPESPSKYVDMSKPLTMSACGTSDNNRIDLSPETNLLLHPCTLNNGGGSLGPQGSVLEIPSSDTQHVTSASLGVGSSSVEAGFKHQADSSLSQYSAKVVLREGKSHSPCVWRRGLIMDSSGSRRISCRDLGQGDHHGWLYRRKDSKGFLLSHRWEKRWFILKRSYLYGYRDKDALKADSLVYLPGFQVCPAPDVKSKRFAFKIYHSSGATFYFACESAKESSRWMSQMGVSAIPSVQPMMQHPQQERSSSPTEAYYSETDDELEKSPSPTAPTRPSSTSKISASKDGNAPPQNGVVTPNAPAKSSKGATAGTPRMTPLGSLSSLTGGKGHQGLRFLQSSSRAPLGTPVPTQNFRSYVRVREGPAARQGPTKDAEPKGNRTPADGRERLPLEAKGVRRKGSLRERLRQLPASLTLERRRGQKSPPVTQAGSTLRVVCGSKSETSLLDSHHGEPWNHSDNSTVPSPRGRSPSDGGRRGSLSSSSLRSVSPRLGSLDCLASPSIPRCPDGCSSLAAQDEYREGSPEKLWIRSLRSPQPLVAPPEGERLKRTSHYQPCPRGSGASPLQPAFELSLTKKSPGQRPQVPPRTKFLSPKERFLSSTPPVQAGSGTPPNLTLSPPIEDAESPRTPLKPAMGVSMIGKQRRTPGALSPREVFFPSAPSSPFVLSPHFSNPSPPTFPGPHSSSRLRASHLDQILPEYPGMEYPPTFEPESYTLNLSLETGEMFSASPPSIPQHKDAVSSGPVNTPVADALSSRASSSPPTMPKPTSATQGYVNISHVSSSLAELTVKSFHHNIYVTSPCREGSLSREMDRQPPAVPPNKPILSAPFSQFHIKGRTPPDGSSPKNSQKLYNPDLSVASSPNPPSEGAPTHYSTSNYLPMGGLSTSYRFPRGTPASRARLTKTKDTESSC